jgi:hypothetical protein
MSIYLNQQLSILDDELESLYQQESGQLPYKLYSWLGKKIVPATERLKVTLTAFSKHPYLSVELHDLRPLLKTISNLIDELQSQGFDDRDKFKKLLCSISTHKWTFSSNSEATRRFSLTPFSTLSDEIIEYISKIASLFPQKKDPAASAKTRLLHAYQKGSYHKISHVFPLRATTLARTNTTGNIERLVAEMKRLSLVDT